MFAAPGRYGSPILGAVRPLVLPDPSAGADYVFPLPGSAWWRFLSARFTLVTSATVQNRLVCAQVTDGTTVLWEGPATAVQAAGALMVYDGAVGAPAVSVSPSTPRQTFPLPDFIIPPGFTFRITVVTKDAADLMFGFGGFIEEHDNGPYGEGMGLIPPAAVDAGQGGY